jgi:hypothetical protein
MSPVHATSDAAQATAISLEQRRAGLDGFFILFSANTTRRDDHDDGVPRPHHMAVHLYRSALAASFPSKKRTAYSTAELRSSPQHPLGKFTVVRRSNARGPRAAIHGAARMVTSST